MGTPTSTDDIFFYGGVGTVDAFALSFIPNSVLSYGDMTIRDMRVDLRLSTVELTVDRLEVGGDSSYTSNVRDSELFLIGGTFNVNTFTNVGWLGNGKISMRGGTVFDTDQLNVAIFSGVTGRFDVRDGSQASANGLSVGALSGADGTLIVTGENSTFTLNGDGAIGGLVGSNGGMGLLSVESGGEFAATGELQVWGDGTVTNTGGIINADTLNINGGGTVSSSRVISVGTTGTGTGINIAREALVTGSNSSLEALSGNSLILGATATGNGVLKVEDYASTGTTGGLYVGIVGTGELAINSGGKASSGNGYIGTFAGSKGTVTVEGTDSKWTNSGSVYVGGSEGGSGGEGSLTVSENASVGIAGNLQVWDEGTVNVTNATLSAGDINVDSGGTVTNSGGKMKSNTLHIEGGGTLSSSGEILIGSAIAPTGTTAIATTAVVTGGGSSLATTGGDLFVGFNDTSELTVEESASVSANGELVVGYIGDGTLNIYNGGSASSATGAIGTAGGGIVTVDGSDSQGVGAQWSVSDSLTVGNRGALAVGNRGLVDVNAALTVSGNGIVTNENLGAIESNTLLIEDGGTVSSGSVVRVGTTLTGTGINIASEAHVTGSNSSLAVLGGSALTLGEASTDNGVLKVEDHASVSTLGFLIVGSQGTGELAINSGGRASNGRAYIGSSAGSKGTVNVLGTDSKWTSGSLYVGGNQNASGGEGELNVGSGATVDVSGALTVYEKGTVTNMGGTIYTDTLRIEGGGEVSSSDEILVGSVNSVKGTFGTASTAVVTGGGSSLTTTGGDLYVGYDEASELTVEQSAHVGIDGELIVGYLRDGTFNIYSGGSASSATGTIGTRSGSDGTVTVDGYVESSGARSQWTLSDALTVGDRGELNVSNLGIVDVGGDLTVSDNGAATNESNGTINAATLTIAGSGTVSSENTISIGTTQGSPGINIESEALVTGDGSTLAALSGNNLYLGATSIGDGVLSVEDSASVSTTGSLSVGLLGTGTLSINSGASAFSGTGQIGALSGSKGTVTVAGTNSKWTSGSLYVGGNQNANGGEGSLTVSVNSVVDVTNTLRVWDDGTVNLVDGIVAATDIDISAGGIISSSEFVRIGAATQTSLEGLNVLNSVDVTGNGALLDATDQIIAVGGKADGTLNISDGARVVGIRARVGDEERGYTGTVNIAGDGSELDITGAFQLGSDFNSTGILNMTDSARLDAISLAVGGRESGNKGTGIANIDTNTVVDIATTTVVYDEGTVNFTDGTFVTHDLSIAAGGTFISNGAGARLDVADTLQVLSGGTVTLDGGVINTTNFDSTAGTFSFDDGMLNINGGTLNTGTDLTVNGASLGKMATLNLIGGSASYGNANIGQSFGGTVAVSNGGLLDLTGNLSVYEKGALNVSDDGGVDVLGALNVLGGGTVTFDEGIIKANTLLIEDGGKFSSTLSSMNIGTTATSGDGTYIADSATVTGSESALTITQDLALGVSGTGGLTVSDNGQVSVGDNLQVLSGGTVTLDGGVINTTNFDSTAGTFSFDDGTLNINGGTLNTGTDLTLDGAGSGDTATLNLVDGSASYANATIGQTNGGVLAVSAGGDFAATGNLEVGDSGTVSLTDGRIDAADMVIELGGEVTTLETVRIGNGGGSPYEGLNANDAIMVDGGLLEASTVYLTMGQWSDGTLDILNGGKVNVLAADLGVQSGRSDTATVTLDGVNSQLNVTDDLSVGHTASNTGILNVQASAEVTANNLYVGGTSSGSGGTGELNVYSGSSVTVTSDLTTWDQGTVTLDGGVINANDFDSSAGTFNFDDGTLNINGGTLNTGTDLTVDGASLGKMATLNLIDGSASYGNANIGQSFGGTVAVSNGGLLDLTGNLSVYEKGALNVSDDGGVDVLGALNVLGGGTVTFDEGIIKANTLLIEDGGKFSSTLSSMWIGTTATSRTGDRRTYIADSAMVTGNESALTVSQDLSLGVIRNGNGALYVEDGASVVADSYLIVGAAFGGSGTLDINTGGRVNTAQEAIIAFNRDTVGAVMVDGSLSQWSIDSDLYVGYDGAGTLDITNGGSVLSGTGKIGARTGSEGTVEVTGTDSHWNISDSLTLGGSGSTGSLSVSDNGQVNVGDNLQVHSGSTVTLDGGVINTTNFDSTAGTFNFDDGALNINGGNLNTGTDLTVDAANPGDVATLNLIGGNGSYANGDIGASNGGAVEISSGGTLDFSSNLTIASAGTATLTDGRINAADIVIESGGVIDTQETVRIGDSAQSSFNGLNATDSITVDGGALEASNEILNVGQSSDGTLDIRNGGAVNVYAANLGVLSDQPATGTITVAGAGSQLNVRSTLFVGQTASNDGVLEVSSSAKVTAGSVYVGGDQSGSGGTGEVNVSSGGVVDAGSNLTLYNTGKVNLAGGSVTAAIINNEGTVAVTADSTLTGTTSNSNSGRVEVTDSSTLTVAGDFTHNGDAVDVAAGSTVIFEGAVDGASDYTGTGSHIFEGSFGPGNSPGLVNIAGDVTYGAGHTLTMELAGITQGSQYDVVAIAGTATLGGLLDVDLLSGFLPTEGDSFDLLTAATLVGTFNFDTALGDGLVWDLQYLLDDPSGQDIVRLSAVSAVPVPAAVWLFGSGILGLVAIGRRRRSVA